MFLLLRSLLLRALNRVEVLLCLRGRDFRDLGVRVLRLGYNKVPHASLYGSEYTNIRVLGAKNKTHSD